MSPIADTAQLTRSRSDDPVSLSVIGKHFVANDYGIENTVFGLSERKIW
jgi:hypothetical protein